MSNTLVKLNAASRMLAEAKTFEDIISIRNVAVMAETYAKAAKLGLEAQNHAAEVKIRAERKAGKLFEQLERNEAGRPAKNTPNVGTISEYAQVLKETETSTQDSSRWQTIANMPEREFEIHIAETRAEGKELTTAAIVRTAKKLLQEEEAQATADNILTFDVSNQKYRAIVIDPPWPVQKILRDVRPKQDVFDYRTMTVEEIGELPIPDLADENGCHVYLWVTHKFLPVGFQLFEQWGVKYECLMTWVKNVGFTPFSWMYSTEHVLFGRIGSLKVAQKGLRLDFQAKVKGHSRKPQIFYDLVVRASPEPRLELFARKQREGFNVWGEEV